MKKNYSALTKPSGPQSNRPRTARSKEPLPDNTFQTVIQTSLWWFKELGIYLVGFMALMVVLGKFHSRFKELGVSDWRIVGTLASVPLVLAFLFDALPNWRKRMQVKKLERYNLESVGMNDDSFRLGPYADSKDDRKLYNRADQSHERALKWIKESRESVLYLTGLSGCGKTSMLKAHVLPYLRSAMPLWRVIYLRGFGDPLSALRSALVEFVHAHQGTPDLVDDVRSLLQLTVDQSSLPGPVRPLLLVFDQFEEFLTVHVRHPNEMGRLQLFLRGLIDKPIAGITALLVFRSEYVLELQNLELPRLHEHENWYEIPPFTEMDARNFLQKSKCFKKIGEGLLDELLTQMAALEDMPGLIRPILLNMVGLALCQSPQRLQQAVRKGKIPNLLIGWVEDRVNAPTLRDYARPLLRQMITQTGTKQPCDEIELAKGSRLSGPAVRGCLVLLSKDGLVRPLGDDQLHLPDQQQTQTWEVSHDFVARLLSQVLAPWRSRWWERIRPWVAPVSLLVWPLTFLVVLSFRREIQKLQGMDTFGRLGAHVEPETLSDEKPRQVSYESKTHDKNWEHRERDFAKNVNLASVIISSWAHYQRILNLQTLRFYGPGLPKLPGLGDLTNVLNLYINCPDLLGLPNLEKMTSLRILDLKSTPIGNIINVGNFPKLRELYVSRTSIEKLLGLEKLSNLEILYVDGTKLTELPGLEELTALQILGLMGSQVKELNGLERLTKIRTLYLNDTKLARQPDVERLHQLEDLELDHAYLDSLPRFEKMLKLEHVFLRGTRIHGSELTIDQLDELKRMNPRITFYF